MRMIFIRGRILLQEKELQLAKKQSRNVFYDDNAVSARKSLDRDSPGYNHLHHHHHRHHPMDQHHQQHHDERTSTISEVKKDGAAAAVSSL